MKKHLRTIILLFIFTHSNFASSASIDDGIKGFKVDADFADVYDYISFWDAEDFYGVHEFIKLNEDFSGAYGINLKKAKLSNLFGLKIIQAEVYFKIYSHYEDEKIKEIQFYLTLPKNADTKAKFVNEIESEFGHSFRWTSDSLGIVRMDWQTEKSFLVAQLGYDMATDKTMDYYILSLSQNYTE